LFHFCLAIDIVIVYSKIFSFYLFYHRYRRLLQTITLKIKKEEKEIMKERRERVMERMEKTKRRVRTKRRS
jgi:hypothetical protein